MNDFDAERAIGLEVVTATTVLFEQTHGRQLRASDCPLLYKIVSANKNKRWREAIRSNAMIPYHCVPVVERQSLVAPTSANRDFSLLPPLIGAYAAYKHRKAVREGAQTSLALSKKRKECVDETGASAFETVGQRLKKTKTKADPDWRPSRITVAAQRRRQRQRQRRRQRPRRYNSERHRDTWHSKLQVVEKFIVDRGVVPRAKYRPHIEAIGFCANEWLSTQVRKACGTKLPPLDADQRRMLIAFLNRHKESSRTIRKHAEKFERSNQRCIE